MEEYELTSVRVLQASGTFVMECDDGQRVEFELSSMDRDQVHLTPTEDTAAGFRGLRARLLWVMSGPDSDAQETPAVLRVGFAHTIFIADGPDVRSIDLPVATRLTATDWVFNSEVPAQEWPAAVFPPGREFKPWPAPAGNHETADGAQTEGGGRRDDH